MGQLLLLSSLSLAIDCAKLGLLKLPVLLRIFSSLWTSTGSRTGEKIVSKFDGQGTVAYFVFSVVMESTKDDNSIWNWRFLASNNYCWSMTASLLSVSGVETSLPEETSWQLWIYDSNSAVCWEILMREQECLDIILDFWHTRRPLFVLKQFALNLIFIFNDSIRSVFLMWATILNRIHQWETKRL